MPPKRAAALAAFNKTAAGEVSDDSGEEYDDVYDELMEDEEADEGTDKKPRRRGDLGTILAGKLNRPRYATMSTKTLHDIVHNGQVTLVPAYQRDVVWNESKMVGLIQSLMLNYYIPPVLFAVENAGQTGDEMRICMDGKQRCTSILWFMDGKIPFISPATKERFWYNKFATTKSGKQLPEALKREFDMIQLSVVEYDNLPEDTQRDLFQRVQMGVALSAAEKLQAIASPWSDWVGELEKKYVAHQETLGHLMTWDRTRGKPFQNIVGFLMLASDPTKHVTPSMASMKKFLSRADHPEAPFKAKVQMALALFVNMVTNHADVVLKIGTKVPRVSPVEFWFIGYMIYSRMNNLSLATIAEQIGRIRTAVHAEFPGHVFTNSTVTKFLFNMIAGLPKKRKADETPAAEGFENDDEVDEREIRAAKRARKAEEADPTYVGDKLERTILAPETVTTRNRAAAVVNGNASTSGSATPAGASVATPPATPPVQAHRPAPVNTAVAASAAAAQRGASTASLPTPQTSTSQQPYQPQPQMYNQQPVNGQYSSPVATHAQAAIPSSTITQAQAMMLAQQNQQPRPTPSWAAAQSMSSEQSRLYHQARAQAQIQQAQQQQQAQQGNNQYYGR